MPKIYLIFEQNLENEKTGVFGIDDDGKAYWKN
jgi:hypothetical protein